ncbi:MAG: 23S rRNA (guanosine-2'-O-)-methyltransferase RlmB [Chlamydiia bacterium]|nr:23S rRNA (guanosine-2'-O-)-methyltransferase RlmB [Chlamydiia bacterium]
MKDHILTSANNKIIKHLAKLTQSRSYRYETKRVIVDNPAVIEELALTHYPRTLITKDKNCKYPNIKAQQNIIVTADLLKKITGLASPQPIAAEFDLPTIAPLTAPKKILVFDQVQNPGNLGGAIRSALAFDFDGIFLITPSVDPFHPQAMGAARGANFHLPIQMGSFDELLTLAKAHHISLIRADLGGAPLSTIPTQEKLGIILGNEGHGFSDEAKNHTEAYTIAINPAANSLNVGVSAAILMYHITHWSPNG